MMMTIIIGQQVTNAQGVATFNTVYPGWYSGRATHVHIKVHIGASLTNIGNAIYAKGGHVSHTGQMFFDDQVTDTIAQVAPYTQHIIQRVRNNQDGLYNESNGATMTVAIKLLGSNVSSGTTGAITVGVDPTATPPLARPGDGPPGSGPRPPRTSTTRP